LRSKKHWTRSPTKERNVLLRNGLGMTETSQTSGVFLSKGASAQREGSKTGRQNNPRSSYTKFRSNKYFKPNPSRNDTGRSVDFKEKPK
jgi:hypothetical protein